MRKTLTQALLAAFCAVLARGTSAAHVEGGGVMQIASRISMWSGARTPTAKDYVQSGLVRHFDGIENGGYGVHRVGAWVDLVSGLEATIGADSEWVGNCLRRTSKTNNAGNMAYLSIDAYNTLAKYFQTIEIVARPTAVGFVYTEQSYRTTNNSARQHGYIWFDGSKVYLGHYSAKSIAVDITKPATYCFTQEVVDGEYKTINAYINGVSTDAGAWGTYYNSQQTIAIGGSNGSGRSMLGDFYELRLYSQTLTASEIARNYAIDKERFGLT